jgi:uncharacterized protein (DUF488 family)
MGISIFTIGHSTHPIDEFIRILNAYNIELLVDIRTIPRSRANPQFNETELKTRLEKEGIEYLHSIRLGGLRHTTKASINTAWKNTSFRGFADYLQTKDFQAGLEQLLELARRKRTVIMCAESVPWRCHRSLIGDALLVRVVHVEDILGEKNSKPHKLTPWARVEGNNITYPGTEEQTVTDR